MRITDRVIYQALLFFRNIVLVLPRGTVLAGGRCAGRIAYFLMPRRRAITLENLRRAYPLKSPKWRRDTALEAFGNLGRNAAELIKFSAGKYFDMVDTEGLEKTKGGCILLTGHLGHWEITGMVLPASGTELFPVGRRIHSLAFDRIVDDLRTAFGSYHIPYRNSIRQILSKIRTGKNICVLVDQRMKSGLPVHFFGRPVWATHIAPVLFRKTGVRVVPASSRHENGRVLVKYEDPLGFVRCSDPLKADFINTGIQMRWLEGKVRENPGE